MADLVIDCCAKIEYMPLDEGTEVAVVVGRASGASGWRDVDDSEARGCFLRGIFELRPFCFTDCSSRSSWTVRSFTYSSPLSEIGLSWIGGDT